MTRKLNDAERVMLEQMIDHVSLFGVLHALSVICQEKSEHIRANWQDKRLARRWDVVAGRIVKAYEYALDL